MKNQTSTRLCTLLLAAAGLAVASSASAQCLPDEIFADGVQYGTDELPLGVALADLNGDGIADAVTANFFGNTISILTGNGDGTFQASVEISMVPDGSPEVVGPVQPAIGDINGDGINDLVIGLNNQLAVLIGNGDGTFQDFTYYGFGSMIRGVVIADMNNDGFPDVVYSSRDDNAVNVLLGNGDGTFQPDLFFAFPQGPVGAVVRDFNNDGFLDVAAPLVFSSEVVIAHGDGTGNLTEVARYAASSPEWLEAGDLNGDGVIDLVTPFTNGSAVEYLIGNADGTFQPAQTLAVGDLLLAIGVEDVNSDGFDDIVAGRFLLGDAFLFLSNGDGTFQAGVSYPGAPRSRKIAFADLNSDGTRDMVTANGQVAGTISVFLNECGGSAPCTGDIADDFGTAGADGQVSFGDFLALLGLIGPCDGGNPGCTGDIADDFGTLGGDGQVSFGDFLALLGLIGPCA